MNTGKILYVGDDICARVNVLEHVGYTVATCDCETASLREALTSSSFDAVLFQCIPEPPGQQLLDLCRALSGAPLVIFADYQLSFNLRDFDAVVPVLSNPRVWLREIAAAIALHRNPDRAKPPQADLEIRETGEDGQRDDGRCSSRA